MQLNGMSKTKIKLPTVLTSRILHTVRTQRNLRFLHEYSNKQAGFHNGDGVRLLRGTNCTFYVSFRLM
jgi:hypothetical protein